MQVCGLYWWQHDCKTPKVTTAQIHDSVAAKLRSDISKEIPTSVNDYEFTYKKPENCNVMPEEFGINLKYDV